MASNAPESNDLVIRKSHLSTDHLSSRLIKRGLAALNESRTLRLEGYYRLIAFEAYVFVLTDNWDAHGTMINVFWSESDGWKNQRRVVLYEFHRSGVYIGKIILPLIKFTAEGYTGISKRRPGKVTIRSTFIHFCEHLQIPATANTPNVRIDSTGGRLTYVCSVRIDYLFSRTGERRAVWSDNGFVNWGRHDDEPIVPISPWLKADWITETLLISLERSEHFLVTQDIEEWVNFIQGLQEPTSPQRETPSIPFTVHTYHPVDFPAHRSLYADDSLFLSLSDTTTDPKALWFFGNEPKKNEQHKTLVWKMEMSAHTPLITTFTLPHPYELLRRGDITLSDGDQGDAWTPTDADYQRMKGKYDEQFDDENGSYFDGSYDGKYFSLYAWDEDLVIYTGFDDSEGDVPLIFRIEEESLSVVKALDPEYTQVTDLVESWIGDRLIPRMRTFDSKADITDYSKPPSIRLGRHEGFADGHLFSVVRWGWYGNEESFEVSYENGVVVTDVNTGVVTGFRPEVPESESEPAVLVK